LQEERAEPAPRTAERDADGFALFAAKSKIEPKLFMLFSIAEETPPRVMMSIFHD